MTGLLLLVDVVDVVVVSLSNSLQISAVAEAANESSTDGADRPHHGVGRRLSVTERRHVVADDVSVVRSACSICRRTTSPPVGPTSPCVRNHYTTSKRAFLRTQTSDVLVKAKFHYAILRAGSRGGCDLLASSSQTCSELEFGLSRMI